jgi:peptidoglycan hydrolase-like protein with peptidoglycan-binding domain
MLFNWKVSMKRLLIICSLALLCALFVSVGTAKPVAAAASTSFSCPPTLQNGSSGTWVRALQYRLNYEEYYGNLTNGFLSVDGSFGPLTQSAVRAFQTKWHDRGHSNMSIDGIVGSQTWGALGMCFSSVPAVIDNYTPSNFTACPPTLQRGSYGTWVKVLQTRLNYQFATNGVSTYPNTITDSLVIDGDFGAKTQAMVVNYQYGWALSVDGIVGPQTWANLGFC